MTTKAVKVDCWALENARHVLTEQLQPRFATRITSPGVSSFIDEEFVARFGAGLPSAYRPSNHDPGVGTLGRAREPARARRDRAGVDRRRSGRFPASSPSTKPPLN